MEWSFRCICGIIRLPSSIPPSMSHPSDPVSKPPSLDSSGDTVPASAHPIFEAPWEIPPRPSLWRRWRRGWRLILVLAVLGVGYLYWRGGKDYYHFKAWRGRGLTADATAAAAAGSPEKAMALLDRAAILAPLDPVVMRSIADFCEPRRDIMAIYALRQIVKSGKSTPADVERLCTLCLDWGNPELAPNESLKAWAAQPADQLSATQLRLSAVWLASRGQHQEGERRLRQALENNPGTPEAASLEVALCRLLMNAADSTGLADAAAGEPLRRLSSVAYSPSAALPLRTEATRLLAGLLLHPSRRALLTPVRADLLRTAFLDLVTAVQKDDPAAATAYQLAATTVELAASPDRRASLLNGILEKSSNAPLPERLATAKWFNENNANREALSLCDRTPEQAGDKDWFTTRMDALFALKEYATAMEQLISPSQPLSLHLQQLFLYRVELASKQDEATLSTRRRELERVCALADPKEAIAIAGNLEKSGDREAALAIYSILKGDTYAGLQARLGIVRCLDPDPARTLELIQALESVLQLWPQSEEARSDLAYLRLLDSKPSSGDLTLVAELHRESPWYLSYRVAAALAQLHQKNPAEAMTILKAASIPWERVRPGWQAVYAGVLAANGKTEEALAIATRLKGTPLHSGEQKLLGK